MTTKRLILSLAISIGLSGSALAGPIYSDLTPADYITIGNLDWAYAAPVSNYNWYGYSYLDPAPLHAGWREATDEEWLTHPTAADFGGKCASIYWNSAFTHCDFGDPLSQHWGAGNFENHNDLLYVRDAITDAITVPEPTTLALLGLGLAGLGFSRRKQ